MPESQMPWFRTHSGISSDPKLGVASRLTGLNPMVLLGIWITLLDKASQSPIRGALYVTFQERFSNEDVTAMIFQDIETTERIIDVFVRLEMLEIKDGAIYIKNWDKRQYTSDYSTERVRRFRQKKTGNDNETLQKRFNAVPVTPPESESESESDLNLEEGEGTAPETPGWIFKLYESEMGLLTPMISETIQDTEKDYPRPWIEAAVKVAATNQARNWKYVEAVLARWKVDGFDAPYPRGPTNKSNGKRVTEPAGFSAIRAFLEKEGEDGE